jgi:hypothetical protein
MKLAVRIVLALIFLLFVVVFLCRLALEKNSGANP